MATCACAPCVPTTQLAAKYHPDKVRGSDREKAAATEKFKEVGEAYGE